MPAAPVLEAVEVSKRFGSTQALKDISITLEAGSVVALVGENGAGKSTLLKILSGLVVPDSGIIRMSGTPVNWKGRSDSAAAGIHLVHQELALLPERSVTQNIFLGMEHRRNGLLDWQAMQEVAVGALQQLGVTELSGRERVGNLSTSLKQFIEIARGLVSGAQVIILDEPTAALSPEEARRLLSIIKEMKTQQGIAFAYVSHRLDEVLTVADSVVVLKDGNYVASVPATQGTPEGLIGMMVGRRIQQLYPPRTANTQANKESLLRVRGLVDPPDIREVSLDLFPGEIVGLYGLEGHGQEAVLACLAGARKPTAGELWLLGGKHPWGMPQRMIASGVGFVPEDRKTQGLVLDWTTRDNIVLPMLQDLAAMGVRNKSAERSSAQRAFDVAGVVGTIDKPVASLSGGNQQKVVLSKWIAAGSRVLLLNQPTRGVDIGSKAEIYQLIRDTCASIGAGAIVVSREIAEMQGLCDRVLVMSYGKLVAEFKPTVSEEEVLAACVGH